MKRLLVPLLLAMAALLAGCQSAPEEPIIIGKSNEGWSEYEAEPQNAIDKAPYAAPERLEYKETANDLDIVVSANVRVPDFTEYPVYILEPLAFTQEMADRIIPALLDGCELYEEGEARTKAFIQDRINYYTLELEAATSDPEYKDRIAPYQEILADLMRELETAPDRAERVIASRELKFKPIEANIGGYLLNDYGELVMLDNGTYDYVWTDDALKKASAAGNEAISGVCYQPSGRQMLLLMENNERYSKLSFVKDWNDGTGRQLATPDFDEAEAKRRADELLARMGLECDFQYCERVQWEAIEGSPDEYYELCYKTAIPGTVNAQFKFADTSGGNADYAEPLKQEHIKIQLDGHGLYQFEWQHPVRVKRVEMQSAQLLPWETVCETMLTMLKVKNIWAYQDDAQNAYITGRRLEIDSIELSYMQVRKDAGLAEQYYIPVWDACGRLIYQFSKSYKPAVGGGWLVDENFERSMFGYGKDLFLPVSLLTINAIDGSVIDRTSGY